jgi:PTS system mannose-specific IIA component
VNSGVERTVGIVIIAHAPLASALAACAQHVYGSEPSQCGVLDVPPDQSPPETLAAARAMCASVDSGAGVLVLTDLFGASPANIAVQLVRAGQIEVLSGVNLPMLLRALTYRTSSALAVLLEKASAGATAGVMKLTSTAPQNQQIRRDPQGGTTPSPDETTSDAHARLHHQQ